MVRFYTQTTAYMWLYFVNMCRLKWCSDHPPTCQLTEKCKTKWTSSNTYINTNQRRNIYNGSKDQTRLAQEHSAMPRQATQWKNNGISFPTTIKLYKSLVRSILLHGCESWTSRTDLEMRIQAFYNKCYRRMLGISYGSHKANEYVICMETGLWKRHLRRTSGTLTVNRQT